MISDYSFNTVGSDSRKRVKRTHFSPEIVVELYDRKGKLCPIRALVDSGTTSTLLLHRYVNSNSPKAYKSPETTVLSCTFRPDSGKISDGSPISGKCRRNPLSAG